LHKKRINVFFFLTAMGSEPVRNWLLTLSDKDRKCIGSDIKSVELNWPVGMPVVRKLSRNLWEVRSSLTGGRISRVLFTIISDNMVLLHGFMKISQKTPKQDIDLAIKRMKSDNNGGIHE
jgi:phage-related protein